MLQYPKPEFHLTAGADRCSIYNRIPALISFRFQHHCRKSLPIHIFRLIQKSQMNFPKWPAPTNPAFNM